MKKILSFILPIALVAGFTACNKENPENGGNGGTTPTPSEIGKIAITVSETTTTSLTFTWPAVEQVGSYKYKLTAKGGTETIGENSGALQGSATTATCTGLAANTEYTFTLEAYKDANATELIAKATKNATTTALTKLAAPTQVEIMDAGNGFVSISWNEVENAASYAYSIKSGTKEKKDTITDVAAMARYLANGTYTLSVVALPEKNSTVYSKSDAATSSEALTINRTKTGEKKLDITVTYYDTEHYDEETGEYAEVTAWCSEDATLEIYDDGTYLLKNFLKGNKDLAFTFNDEGTYILNAYGEAEGYQYVYTGLESPNNIASFYEGDEDYLYCVIDDEEEGSYFGGVFYIGEAGYWIDIAWDVPASQPEEGE